MYFVYCNVLPAILRIRTFGPDLHDVVCGLDEQVVQRIDDDIQEALEVNFRPPAKMGFR
jgi:hypothetical protein